MTNKQKLITYLAAVILTFGGLLLYGLLKKEGGGSGGNAVKRDYFDPMHINNLH